MLKWGRIDNFLPDSLISLATSYTTNSYKSSLQARSYKLYAMALMNEILQLWTLKWLFNEGQNDHRIQVSLVQLWKEMKKQKFSLEAQ